MERYSVNIPRLIVQLLPPHKRKGKRIALLQAFADLKEVWNSFDAWRNKQLTRMNVSSQIIVLEGYLRSLSEKNKGVSILSYENSMPAFYLSTETDTHFTPIQSGYAAAPDDNDLLIVPLFGESDREFEDCDFKVFVPNGADTQNIETEVNKYKLACKKFKIVNR